MRSDRHPISIALLVAPLLLAFASSPPDEAVPVGSDVPERVDDLVGRGSDVVRLQVPAAADGEVQRFLSRRFHLESRVVRRGHLEFPRNHFDVADLNQALVEGGFRVSSITARRGNLEELFVKLTGESQEVH